MIFYTKLFLILSFLIAIINPAILYSQEFDGYALYNNGNENTTFLINKDGDIAHTWSLNRPCNYAVLMMDNGNIMRGAVNQGNQINGAAVGGLVQEIDPQGNVVWGFTYSSSEYVAHHDICLMPDGNVLLTAWEVKSNAELQALGYTGTSSKYPTHLIEVSQIEGTTEGEIVWEWHIIDHMIQDVDETKPNYGVVADHPELMDINVPSGGFGGPGGGGDWFHVNGVDYNAELDMITFSSRFLSEIFIIDHSTTTEEAAGHTGGNSGMGGDFLYRWGNPSNYDTPGNQKIAGPVHDARWVPDDGRPRAGYLQFFNNEGTNGNGSTVDAIELPFTEDGYNFMRTAGEEYGPSEATWRHVCRDDASGQSASYSLPNGNTFVNLSREYMYEVDENDQLVWQYSADPAKAFRYTCDHPGIQALIAQGVLTDGTCPIISATNEIEKERIRIAPNPSNAIFNIKGLASKYQVKQVIIYDVLGKEIQNLGAVSSINLSDHAAGMYYVNIRLNNDQLITKKVFVIK